VRADGRVTEPSGTAHLVRRGPVARLEGAAAPVTADDALAVEEPLELVVDGETIAMLMRTPGHDRALVLGLLRAEGVLERPGDVAGLRELPARIEVTLTPEAAAREGASRRLMITTSACGICSRTAIGEVVGRFGRAPLGDAAVQVPRALLFGLPARLRAAQRGFAESGGLHAAALFDAEGARLWAHEDIGRHNALDKVVGQALLAGRVPTRGHVVVVSGRASYELVAKVAAIGAEVLAAVSAPSTLAADLADKAGITLVGFLRGESMNVYTHPERFVG
jgi:FdhD protein